MGTQPKAYPPITLPPVHAHQLCCRTKPQDAVDVPVGISVVLPRVLLHAIHIHGGDSEVVRLQTGQIQSSLFDLSRSHPQPLRYILAGFFIVQLPGLYSLFSFFSGSFPETLEKDVKPQRQTPRDSISLQIFDPTEELAASCKALLRHRVLGQI
jgi:hypothetical protein